LGNIIPAVVVSANDRTVSALGQTISLPAGESLPGNGMGVNMLLLPDVQFMDVRQASDESKSAGPSLKITGKVAESVFLEGNYRLAIQADDLTLHFVSPLRFNTGDLVTISYPTGEIQCL
jgi:hypothetical protein